MTEATYSIGGMTCENCVRHAGDALRGLPGVREVRVDLASGSATVRSVEPLAREAVQAALADEGYELR